MVGMVHTNNFYEIRLDISEGKKELGRKSNILEGSKTSKISFEVENLVFEGKYKTKITSKNIATPSATILTCFSIQMYILVNSFYFIFLQNS